ncbi:MAG: hypothetical protein ACJ72Y_05915, partial [Actinomycetes bacterium]
MNKSHRVEWRSRFQHSTVGFPSWSPFDPDRLVFVSDEGGVTQVWTCLLSGAGRRPITDQRVGVEEFVLSPRGDRVAWWRDDSGDGYGEWTASSIAGTSSGPLLTKLEPGWSEGLAWCGDQVAIALTDGEAYRVYTGRPGEPGRLIYHSVHPAGLGREWTTSSGGLSTDGSIVCLRHSESGDMLHFALRAVQVEDGSTVGDLADPGKTMRVSAWSPRAGDDRVAIIHELEGVERPAIWNPRNGNRRNFPSDLPGEIDVLGWFPDATALLTSHWYDGRSQLYRLALDSGQYELLHDPAGYVSAAGVRPDGEVWLRAESGAHAPVVRTVAGEVKLGPPERPPQGVDYSSMRFIGPSGGETHMMVAAP